MVCAAVMLGLMAASGVGVVADDRTLLNESVWVKPLKFGFAFALYAGTLAWLLSKLNKGKSVPARPVAAHYYSAMLLDLAQYAFLTGFGKAANAHQARVLRRAGNGSATAFRWFCAFRAGLSTLYGTVLGAVAGCPAGMLLLWPLTVRITWDEPVRVPFETPWPAIVAVVVGLPLLAATLGALLAREQSSR